MAKQLPDTFDTIHLDAEHLMEVLSAPGVFSVYCNGVPMNMRKVVNKSGSSTYMRTTFPSKGHALRLAKMLNDGSTRGCVYTVHQMRLHKPVEAK